MQRIGEIENKTARSLPNGLFYEKRENLQGSIIRLNMKLTADEGEDLSVDATAFIPDVEEYWGDFPSFIGQIGFLERICFAVNPSTDTFYFGLLP